jgi:hypothetical protein
MLVTLCQIGAMAASISDVGIPVRLILLITVVG